MRQLLRWTLAALVLTVAGSPAHAGLLALDYQGVTSVYSSLAGTPIAIGTNYTIQADFDPTTGTTEVQGIARYLPTSLAVTVGGTSYTVTDLSDFVIGLVDATNQAGPGFTLPLLENAGSGTAFYPVYTTATPAFSAVAPTPTIFSGYVDSIGNSLTFSTTAGSLVLDYDPGVGIGVGASLVSVPEPSSLILSGAGGLMALGSVARRRRAKVAA